MSALEILLMQQLIANAVDVARLDAGERGKILAMLDRLEKDLTALMGSRVLSEMGKQSTQALLKEVTALIQETYTEVQLDIAATLEGLAPVSSDATAQALENVLNITIGKGARPSAGYLETLASDVLIDGSPSAKWWSRQAGDVAFRFAAELRKGLVAGETNQQIIARIVGTKDVPGIMPIARKNAAALVQTSVATVANESKLAMYRKNADIIKGVEYLATLDGHTCFVAGTLVSTPDGLSAIESLRAGDSVIGGSGSPRLVVGTSKTIAKKMARIVLSNGETFVCTQDHRLLAGSGEWVEAGMLKAGDLLATELK